MVVPLRQIVVAAGCSAARRAMSNTRLARMSGDSIVLRSSTVSSGRVREQPARLAQPRAVERVAHAAGVGELRLLDAVREVFLERLARAGTEAVVLLLEHHLGDAQQLAFGVKSGKSR